MSPERALVPRAATRLMVVSPVASLADHSSRATAAEQRVQASPTTTTPDWDILSPVVRRAAFAEQARVGRPGTAEEAVAVIPSPLVTVWCMPPVHSTAAVLADSATLTMVSRIEIRIRSSIISTISIRTTPLAEEAVADGDMDRAVGGTIDSCLVTVGVLRTTDSATVGGDSLVRLCSG